MQAVKINTSVNSRLTHIFISNVYKCSSYAPNDSFIFFSNLRRFDVRKTNKLENVSRNG